MKLSGGQATIPEGWRLVRLGDAAEVVTGNTPPRETSEYYGGSVPWVKPSDLVLGRFVDSSDEYLTGAGVKLARKIPENCVLVSCIGTIGETAISKVPLCFNQQINALIPGDLVWPPFLYWACNSQASRLLSLSAKTAVPILNKSEFSAVPILLPPLPEQRAIATVLDSIDDAVERTEAVIAATERLRDSLLHQLLSSGVYGWHTEWKDVSGLGTIPADWEVVRLGEVAEVKGGKRLPKGSTFADADTGLLYIRVVDFRDRTVDTADIKFLRPETHEFISRYTISSADVYISIAGTIGLVGSVPARLDGANLTENAAKIVIAKSRRLTRYFLLSYLDSFAGQSQIRERINALGQPKLALERIRTIRVPMPSIAEQQALAGLLNALDVTVEHAQHERNQLQLLKESTADALLTGRVRVGD